MKCVQKDQGYIVLITVLILGIAATTIGLFILVTGTNASLASADVAQGVQAKAAADGCANLALKAIQQNPTLATPANGSAVVDGIVDSSCTYEITGNSPNYQVISIGVVKPSSYNVVNKMTITLDQVSPNLHVVSWRETP